MDDVIPEPEGGAHTDPAGAVQLVNDRLERHLADLNAKPVKDMLAQRYEKFRNIAQFFVSA